MSQQNRGGSNSNNNNSRGGGSSGRGRGGGENNQSRSSSSSSNAGAAAPVKFLLQAPLRNRNHEPVSNTKWCFTGGYLGLFGDLMDNPTSEQYDITQEQKIPESYKENQRKRDGNAYHMTVMLKQEFKKCSETVDTVFADTIQQIKQREGSSLPKKFDENKGIQLMYVLSELVTIEDFKILGVGRANQGPEEAYFRVVEWESANNFLTRLGLPRKDFHITIGFKSKDVHNVAKNIHTLVLSM